VKDQKNPHNFDQIGVSVVSVGGLESVENRKELIMNAKGNLYVKATDMSG